MLPTPHLDLSGDRFCVTYRLTGSLAEARRLALDTAVEQTVKFPYDLVPSGSIKEEIVGRIESFESDGGSHWLCRISYPVESSGFELLQLLNVIFGNSCMRLGIRLERIDLPAALLCRFRGPRFGAGGLRERLKVARRPLLCTPLRPMGLPPRALADLAYQFALGGIDLIKDDHGLTDQPFAPFAERVERCAEAVARANAQTGRRTFYLPNVTAPVDQVRVRARLARELGAGGLLLSPGLTGFDSMRMLADDEEVGLPIISYPAFLGPMVMNPEAGISPYALFGQLGRLAGADATIYPNWGGRFAFSQADCAAIAAGCAVEMGHIRPILPAPGGGMSLERIPEAHAVYGRQAIYLIGGSIFRGGPDLVERCRSVAALMESLSVEVRSPSR